LGEYRPLFLARSPAYTPPQADVIFEEIRGRFIDEEAFATTT